MHDILAKAGNGMQAAYEPLIAGIGGQFTDAAGIAELAALWGSVQVYPPVAGSTVRTHACMHVADWVAGIYGVSMTMHECRGMATEVC